MTPAAKAFVQVELTATFSTLAVASFDVTEPITRNADKGS